MEHLRVVYITISRDEADKLAREIVENRLAACVNIVPKITSYFWWDDAVQKDDEAMLIVKTTQQRFDSLLKYVRAHHPYDLPEVIALPLSDAFGDYVDWVTKETGWQT